MTVCLWITRQIVNMAVLQEAMIACMMGKICPWHQTVTNVIHVVKTEYVVLLHTLVAPHILFRALLHILKCIYTYTILFFVIAPYLHITLFTHIL